MEHFIGIDAGGWLDKGVTLVVAMVIAWLVERVVVRLMHKVLDASNLPSASLFINIVRAVIWVLALLCVMRPVFGVDPAGFVAALGVVSIAVSLGMQDTISNIIGGISLMLSKSVQPGDHISVGDVTGEVTDVTWRSTSVMMRGGAVEVIPNSVLSKTALTRITPWSVGYCGVPIAVVPGADLNAVAKECCQVAARELADLLDPAFETDVIFTAFSAYGTQGEVRLHVLPDVVFSTAQDRLARSLSGRPWLASAL
ncbi:mechanosensitive ion channel family protein [Thermophilibacter provencensis]|uniref:Mechanosensitive ion channel n=1 Tax=Thermophilibacter provencensis TaxID=1852386 RepID=A0ABT7V3A3_9ACTN|nr:mechanosensitive ion channel domain-containing protein [Thermophilibacter provencensis]MDM8271067.1 mechanosensitive ion channel [Thermophilibacter provencensis]